jgi:hypothetical protein
MSHFCIINYFINFSYNLLLSPSSLGEETAIAPMGDVFLYDLREGTAALGEALVVWGIAAAGCRNLHPA